MDDSTPIFVVGLREPMIEVTEVTPPNLHRHKKSKIFNPPCSPPGEHSAHFQYLARNSNKAKKKRSNGF